MEEPKRKHPHLILAPGPRKKGRRKTWGVEWDKVCYYARLGAERDTILNALGIDPRLLRDAEFVTRLQAELTRGAALLEIDLLQERDKLGRNGRVNAVLAGLRHKLGWDRPESNHARAATRPDLESAVAEIEKTLFRLRGPK